MSAVYITCEVLPGLFSTEYFVLLHDSSCYVHRDHVTVTDSKRMSTATHSWPAALYLASMKSSPSYP
jgi:hypothetical protein